MKFVPVLLVILLVGCSSIQKPKDPIQVDLRATRLTVGSVQGVFNTFSAVGTTTENIQVSYYPQDNVVCLTIRHNFTTFYQFWDKDNREIYLKALDQYKQDYEQRNLKKSNMSTRRNYGVVQGYLIWESTTISGQSFSYPNIELGYQFKNNAPYFSVNMREADNTSEITKNEPALQQNTTLCIYLTRALADDLAALLDENVLQSFARGVRELPKDKEVQQDVYEEKQ